MAGKGGPVVQLASIPNAPCNVLQDASHAGGGIRDGAHSVNVNSFLMPNTAGGVGAAGYEAQGQTNSVSCPFSVISDVSACCACMPPASLYARSAFVGPCLNINVFLNVLLAASLHPSCPTGSVQMLHVLILSSCNDCSLTATPSPNQWRIWFPSRAGTWIALPCMVCKTL